MKLGRRIRNWLTRAHLWVGEHLGLTHYRNCWSCESAVVIDESPAVCGCVATEEERSCTFGYAATDPCEAVWCPMYRDKEGL